MLLRKVDDFDRDVYKNWWVSEKYDGVRGCWTGSKMKSRSGRTMSAPQHWRDKLPPVALDGELYIENGICTNVTPIVMGKDGAWEKIQYKVFDLPMCEELFEERQKRLKNLCHFEAEYVY